MKPSSHCKNDASIDIRPSVNNKEISDIQPLLVQLKYATDGMEAFIILFQKLTSDVSCVKIFIRTTYEIKGNNLYNLRRLF